MTTTPLQKTNEKIRAAVTQLVDDGIITSNVGKAMIDAGIKAALDEAYPPD